MTDVLPRGTTVLGRFQIEGAVGSGATGTAYLVSSAEGPFLLKLLHAASIIDRSRIKRELSRQTSVQHPHVARIFEVADADQHAFLLREYVEGESLAAILAREGPLGLERAAKILREVADGLGELHKKGFVHREVKPGHVLVGPSGAKVIDAAWPSNDPDYTPPEAEGAKLLTLRADLWGLGVLAVHVLSGSPPSQGGTLPPDVPANVASLVESMLQADPGKRPFGTRQVSKTLEPIAEGRPLSAPSAPKKSIFAPHAEHLPGSAPKRPPPPPRPTPRTTAALSEDSLGLQPGAPLAIGDDDVLEPSGLIEIPDSTASPLPAVGSDVVELSGIVSLPDDSGVQPLPDAPAKVRTQTLLGVAADAESEARRAKASKVLGLGGSAPAPPLPPEPFVPPTPAGASVGDTSPYDLRSDVPAVPSPLGPLPTTHVDDVGQTVPAEDLARTAVVEPASVQASAESSVPTVVPYHKVAMERFAALPPRMRIGILAGLAGLVLLFLVIALAGGDGGEEVSAAHAPRNASAPSDSHAKTSHASAPRETAAPATAARATAAPATAAPESALPESAGPETAEPEAESAAPDAEKAAKRAAAADRRRAATAALRNGDRQLASRHFAPATSAYTQAINYGQAAAGYYGLGRVALAQSNPRRAVTQFEKAVRARPRSASYHLALGNAYSSIGNRTKAQSEWRRVLALDPGNRAAMQALGIRSSGTTKRRR